MRNSAFLVVSPRERIKVKRSAEPISQRYDDPKSSLRADTRPLPGTASCSRAQLHIFSTVLFNPFSSFPQSFLDKCANFVPQVLLCMVKFS